MAREEPFQIWVLAATALFVLAFVAGTLFLLSRDQEPADPSGLASPEQARQEMATALSAAASAQESYLTSAPGYTSDLSALEGEGFEPPVEVYVQIVSADEDSYCMEATHTDLAGVYYYFVGTEGSPQQGRCNTN